MYDNGSESWSAGRVALPEHFTRVIHLFMYMLLYVYNIYILYILYDIMYTWFHRCRDGRFIYLVARSRTRFPLLPFFLFTPCRRCVCAHIIIIQYIIYTYTSFPLRYYITLYCMNRGGGGGSSPARMYSNYRVTFRRMLRLTHAYTSTLTHAQNGVRLRRCRIRVCARVCDLRLTMDRL